MCEFDLDRAILKDRKSPLPGQPDANTTVAAVTRLARLEKRRTAKPEPRGGSSQEQMVLGISGAAIALGIVWVLSSPGSPYVLLVIPSIELAALMSLIKREARP